MDALIKQQAEILEAIKSLESNFKKDGSSRKTPEYIRKRLDNLENLWQQFKTKHELILELGDRDKPYFSDNIYGRVKEFYSATKATILSWTTEHSVKPSLMCLDDPSEAVKSTPDEPFTSAKPSTSSGEITGKLPSFPSKENLINESDLSLMLKKQKSHFRAFQRCIDGFNIDELDEQWEIEEKLAFLKQKWGVIDALYWDIDFQFPSGNDSYENDFITHELNFQRLKGLLHKKLISCSGQDRITPRVKIPIFSGKFDDWTSFHDLFMETIHKNKSLSNAQRMQHLKGNIRGEAEKLVQHLAVSAENYNTAWDILLYRYQNRRLLFTTYIDKLLDFPILSHPTTDKLKTLYDISKEVINAISNLGISVKGWDPILVHHITRKLDQSTHRAYFQSLNEPRELQTLDSILSFLESRFMANEAAAKNKSEHYNKNLSTNKAFPHYNKTEQKNVSGTRNNFYNAKTFFSNYNQKISRNDYSKKNARLDIKPANVQTTAQPEKCIPKQNDSRLHVVQSKGINNCSLCNGEHKITLCDTFLNMNVGERHKFISVNKLCKNCLGINHDERICRSPRRCKICNDLHNTLLHIMNENVNLGNQSISAASSSQNKLLSATSTSFINLQTLLPTALVRAKRVDGSYIVLRGLVDQGSHVTILSEHAAQQLSLPRRYSGDLSIHGLGEGSTTTRGVVSLEFQSLCNSEHNFIIEAIVMTKITSRLPQVSFDNHAWEHLTGIQLADNTFNKSGKIDVLFGANILADILEDGVVRGESGTPIAQKTKLGWIISGNFKQSYQCFTVQNNQLDIVKFWQIEEVSNDNENENDFCENLYRETTTRNSEGRYVVRLPMCPDVDTRLTESKYLALTRFKQIERKIKSNIEYGNEYKNFISEYLNLKHMQISLSSSPKDNYLPHHGVWKLDSTSTKMRVVFDASAKTKGGYSLNACMESGPNLQKDLQETLLKWRTFKYAFTADVEKMFRQILINEKDHHYQKILWRASDEEPIKEYALTTVTYGTKAAPFLAMRTLHQLAIDDGHLYPEAAQVLKSSFYMDDVLYGSNDLQKAKVLQRQLIILLKRGGFDLKKWSSNEQCLLEHLDETMKKYKTDFVPDCTDKTLGVHWLTKSDTLTFRISLNQQSQFKTVTKRQFLSDFSRLFDPEGLIGPVILKIKLLFQQLWVLNIGWDDRVPRELESEWLTIRYELPLLERVQVNRWLGTMDEDFVEIHGFSDACERAYAAVIYTKVIKSNGDQIISLLTSKSKVCPLNKKISLPRLELSAALLLAQLMQKVLKSVTFTKYQIHAWTDSTVTLGWLSGDPTRWKTFVANRVKIINSIIPFQLWKYVPSKQNPADVGSRGTTPSKLLEFKLWWQAPDFLHENTIPTQPLHRENIVNQEVNNIQVNNIVTDINQNTILYILSKYSNINTILRIIAFVFRFINNCKLGAASKSKQRNLLTIAEISEARIVLIKNVQKECFAEEILMLSNNNFYNKKSILYNLNPFIDNTGIVRVGGRIRNSTLPDYQKYPIILPQKHIITELILRNAHSCVLHGGPTQTLSFTRRRYWIIGGTRAAKSFVRNCVTCHRFLSNSNKPQLMGNLPTPRVSPSRPFSHTGVDYTGEIEIKANKGRGCKTLKGYIAVFICLFSKAVHLEVVMGLDSNSFLAAFKRMCSRRGTPGHMYSDNGRNFVGANKILKADENNQIEWHFIAPHWPNACGLMESAVKSMKFHLKRIIGEQKLTYEELSTITCQTEACLNSRPLCSLTEDPESLDVLTPGHLITGAPLNALPQNENTITDLRIRWNLVEKMKLQFWKKWSEEYLTNLQKRCKWQETRQNVEVGNIVLVREDNQKPLNWLKGIIRAIHLGSDKLARVATIETENGIIKRPISKLSLLPIKDNENESKTKQTSQKRAKPSFLTNVMYIFLFFFISNNVNANQQNGSTWLNPFSSSPGIYFNSVGEVKRVENAWKIVYYYNMSDYWASMNNFEIAVGTLKKSCNKLIEKGFPCIVITSNFDRELSELKLNNVLLQNHHHLKRRKRGYIDGIGNLARTLFGILDEDFAQKYTEDIAQLKDNDQYLLSLIKNQTLIVEAENNFIKRQQESINNLTLIVNGLTKQIFSEMLDVETNISILMQRQIYLTMVTSTSQIHGALREIQSNLIQYVTDVYQGRVNTHLFSADLLKRHLSVIISHLRNGLSLPISNINENIKDLYKLFSVHTRFNGNFLIFELSLPLTNGEKYNLYKVIPVPIDYQRQTYKIHPTADFIALNLQRDTYILMNQHEYYQCIHMNSGQYLCDTNFPIHTINSKSQKCCEVDIMNEEPNSNCKLYPVQIEEEWTKLTSNSWLYYCKQECRVTIICEANDIINKQLIGAGIIQLEQNCMIKTKEVSIFSGGTISDHIKIPSIPYIHVTEFIPSSNNTYIKVSDLGLINNNRSLEEIDNKLQKIKESNLNQSNFHNTHHYALNYSLLCTVLSVILFLILRKRICKRQRISLPPPPTGLDRSQKTDKPIELNDLNVKRSNQAEHKSDLATYAQPNPESSSSSISRNKCQGSIRIRM